MFFVLLSIAVFLFATWFFWVENKTLFIGVIIGLFFSIAILIPGTMMSSGNYQEEAQYVSSTELMQLNNKEESEIFVAKRDSRKYVYIPMESKNNKEIELKESDYNYIEIIQSIECKKPVLKKYVRKTKWGFFTIGGMTRTEYVFYIPKGAYQGLYD